MNALPERARTLLILGRVSNLPTVWSNILAGAFISNPLGPLGYAALLFGGSFLYVGGMYLNDFCDAEFDVKYCPARPIPAGSISRRAVGVFAVLWFALGLGSLLPFGPAALEPAFLLIAMIVLYDFHHKGVSWAPLIMGLCRFLLFLIATSAAIYPPLPWAAVPIILYMLSSWFFLPPALALGLYVAGITYLARGESRRDKPTRWALLFLVLPALISLLRCTLYPAGTSSTIFFCLLQVGWMIWLLIPLWRKTNRSLGRVVSGLLAGIVLVDIIAVAPFMDFNAAWFLIFFVLALLLQRVVPAT